MDFSNFFASDFYIQVEYFQDNIDKLTRSNFEATLNLIINNSNKSYVRTYASTLLNRIKIKPQDSDLVIDFIESYDAYIKEKYSSLEDSVKYEIMPVFISIVNPMPLHTQFYYPGEINNLQFDRFIPIPISECFIYENLLQRGHIQYDVKEYIQSKKFREKAQHLYPPLCSYEVKNSSLAISFSFVENIQYIHLMPHEEYMAFVSKCTKEFESNPIYNEFSNAKLSFDKLEADNFKEHKKYLREGFNPHPFPTMIRKDSIEEVERFINTIPNFDFYRPIDLSIYDCNVLLRNANILEYSAYYGSSKCFRFFFEKVGMHIQNLFTERLIDFAIIGGNRDILSLIDEYLESVNGKPDLYNQFDSSSYYRNSLPYVFAFHHNDDGLVSELIFEKNCSASFEAYNQNALSVPLICFYFANWTGMKTILSEDYSNISLFFLAAAMFNNHEMFLHLLEIPKINLNACYDKMTPINFLVRYNSHELIYRLIEKGRLPGEIGVDLNHQGFEFFSPLFYCCFFNYYESFSVLIRYEEVDVNADFRTSLDSDFNFNPTLICLKFRQIKMARKIVNHPRFELSKTMAIIPTGPFSNNILLTLNYLLEEKKNKEKKKSKLNARRIDASKFGAS